MLGLVVRVLAVVVALGLLAVGVVTVISVAGLWETLTGSPGMMAELQAPSLTDRVVQVGKLVAVIGWPAGALALVMVVPVSWERLWSIRVLGGLGLVIAGATLAAVGAVEMVLHAWWQAAEISLWGMDFLSGPVWWMIAARGLFDALLGLAWLGAGATLFAWRHLVGPDRWLVRLGVFGLGAVSWMAAVLGAAGCVVAQTRYQLLAWGVRIAWAPDEIGSYVVMAGAVVGLGALLVAMCTVASTSEVAPEA